MLFSPTDFLHVYTVGLSRNARNDLESCKLSTHLPMNGFLVCGTVLACQRFQSFDELYEFNSHLPNIQRAKVFGGMHAQSLEVPKMWGKD
jgi:hypothetical protein